MAKIYTRSGDDGTTGLRGGRRVAKDDIHIEVNGTLDELNAAIGAVRSLLAAGDDRDEMLQHLQREIMKVMHCIASTPEEQHSGSMPLPDSGRCERYADAMMERCDNLDRFVLPAGTPVSAHLHLARTIARRAERRICTLDREEPLPEAVLRFVNRVSDLLFVMAREEMSRSGGEEDLWRPFNSRKE